MEWRFVCRTGVPCVARFDGQILEVEADDSANIEDDDLEEFSDEEDAWDATDALISTQGLARTACASEEIARRELRLLGAEV